MHKQEIIDAWENAPTYLEDKSGEDYYNETFNSEFPQQDIRVENNSRFCSCEQSTVQILSCMTCKKPSLYPNSYRKYIEISDEDIDFFANRYVTIKKGTRTRIKDDVFIAGIKKGAKWYRKQIEKKQWNNK